MSMEVEAMPKQDELPPDPDGKSAWDKMAKNEPSRQALPPATGGNRLAWIILGILGLVVVIALLQGLF
jgi:hypothetical protein